MSDPKNSDRPGLEALADGLVDDILATSDEDILAEAAEDYGDIEAEVTGVRSVFEKAKLQSRKGRLQEAIAAVGDDRERPRAATIDLSDARQKLARRIAADPGLTMAARKGSGIPDEDAEGMLEDLDELDELDANGRKDEER